MSQSWRPDAGRRGHVVTVASVSVRTRQLPHKESNSMLVAASAPAVECLETRWHSAGQEARGRGQTEGGKDGEGVNVRCCCSTQGQDTAANEQGDKSGLQGSGFGRQCLYVCVVGCPGHSRLPQLSWLWRKEWRRQKGKMREGKTWFRCSVTDKRHSHIFV